MYFILPGDLKGIEILVYYYCCTQTNFKNEEFKGKKKFEFNISLRTIEEDISIERKSVSRVLKKLCDLGYIELIEKGKPPKKPSKYLLKFTRNIVNNNVTMNTIINTNMDNTIQDIENTEFTDNQCTIDSTMSATMNPSPSNIYSNIISNNNIYNKSTNEPKKEIPKEYLEILDCWNSLASTKCIDLKEKVEEAIKNALNQYDVETIKTGIRNYNTLFTDVSHFYNVDWELENFLKSPKGLESFLENGKRYIEYVQKQERNKTTYEYNTRTNKKFEEEEFYLKDGTKVTGEEYDRACIEETKRYYEKYCKDIDIDNIDF